MDRVPQEIQKIILNLCDDERRRTARIACKEWFNYIDYRNFVIYLTKKSEWSQIVERFCSYTKPISLHLRKNIINNMKDINEQLLRLTNLTDLTFDDLEEEEENKVEEWLKLTSLPNLHSVNVSNYEYNIPDEVYANFIHLTHFDPRWRSNRDRSLIQKIRQLPDLQSCSIVLDQTIEEDIFEQYYSKMTYLFIEVPDVSYKTAEAWFQNCADIKELQYSVRDHKGDEISLKALTKLEKIVFSGGQIHELNSTNLTFLELFNAKEEYIERALDQLVNLKELVLDLDADGGDDDNDDEVAGDQANNNAVANNNNNNDESDEEIHEGDNKVKVLSNKQLDPDAAEQDEAKDDNSHENNAGSYNDDENDEENDDDDDDDEESYHSADTNDGVLDIDWTNQPRTFSYEWLSSLTSLQHLNIDPMEGDGLTFVPSQIERLQVSVFKPLNLSHVSRFGSLKELYIITSSKKLHDLSAISQLTRLESLQIDVSKGRARLNFPLSVFTNLDWLNLNRCFAEISDLPNLERLILASSSTTGFTGFVGLPKLTQLEFQTNWGFGGGEVVNYTVVSSLTTLKSLAINHRVPCDCSYFSTLTALESLNIYQISSEQDYGYLARLTQLTSLRIWFGLPSEKILQLPTSLQRLDVDLTKPGGHLASEEFERQYEGVDVTSITDQLIARLPNLYKYSFD